MNDYKLDQDTHLECLEDWEEPEEIDWSPQEVKMKHKFYITLLVLTFLTSLLITPKVYTADYTKINLPNGSSARFGKGKANDIKISADGKSIAVASGLGIWLYDVQTYEEIALLTNHDGGMHTVASHPMDRYSQVVIGTQPLAFGLSLISRKSQHSKDTVNILIP